MNIADVIIYSLAGVILIFGTIIFAAFSKLFFQWIMIPIIEFLFQSDSNKKFSNNAEGMKAINDLLEHYNIPTLDCEFYKKELIYHYNYHDAKTFKKLEKTLLKLIKENGFVTSKRQLKDGE